MSRRIVLILDVLEHTLSTVGGKTDLAAVKKARRIAQKEVATERVRDWTTVQSKFVKQMKPRIPSANMFDILVHKFLSGDRELESILLESCRNDGDKKSVEGFFAKHQHAAITVPSPSQAEIESGAIQREGLSRQAINACKTSSGFQEDESKRKLVEDAAVYQVKEYFQNEGYDVESVEAAKCGYDLRCTMAENELHVEVKGTQSNTCQFTITKNELDCARTDPGFVLCLVTSALENKACLHSYSGREFLDTYELVPLQYTASLRT